MRVRCTANTGGALPLPCLNDAIGISASSNFSVTVGRDYAVYAITVFKGNTWYYVLNDDGHQYPVWQLAQLFDVVDPTIPESWEYGFVQPDNAEPGFPLISFPEWAQDHYFYERLVDGDQATADIFARRRREID